MKDTTRTPGMRPAFTWRHYLLGHNMIAGVLQTFTLIVLACLGFGLLCAASC